MTGGVDSFFEVAVCGLPCLEVRFDEHFPVGLLVDVQGNRTVWSI